MLFRKTSIALAAMAACGAAQAAPTNLAFKQPASNQVITSNIYQSPACEITGSGIARVDFYLGSTKLNSEGSAPWNCNLDPRQFKDGAYVLRAVAFDSRNTSASTQINVTLQTGNVDTSGGTTTPPSGGSTSYAGTPFTGTPIALPKAFAAADFDRGGQGVAYSDRSNGNAGGQYRTSEDVDIIAQADSISPYAINSLQSGEWLAYTVNVPASGKYDLAINAAHNYSGTPAFRVEVDGADVTGRISVPKTGSWSTFQWVGKQGVDLAQGKRVVKVVSEAEYFNLKGISVLAAAGTTPTTPPATSGPVVSFKAPLSGATVSQTLSNAACEALVANGGTAIRQVQFFVDGAPLNTEGSAPWNCSFDSTKVADGTRKLRAVATDVNGKTGAAEISVLVANGGGGTTSGNGPTNVAFVAPRSGATISDTLQSSACELTGTGITRVEFSIDGKALNTELNAPWNCNLPTTQYSDGAHKLKAVAYNSSGQTTVAEIDVTINNGGGATGGTGGSTPTEPAGGELKFSCSFETSPTDCGFSEQAKVKPRATLVSTARDGAKAVRLHTEPGDSNVSGSGEWERNDLGLTQAASDCYEGRSGWWAHSIYFPSDYTLPAWGGVVMDFHHTGSGGQANFHIDAMKDGGLRFRGNAGSATNPTTYQVWLGPALKNVWYDFVYHVKWSSKGDGFMRAWVNGVKKLDYSGPTIYAGMGCYLKLANYHDASGSPSSVIHDRVRYGTTAAAVTSTPLQGLQ